MYVTGAALIYIGIPIKLVSQIPASNVIESVWKGPNYNPGTDSIGAAVSAAGASAAGAAFVPSESASQRFNSGTATLVLTPAPVVAPIPTPSTGRTLTSGAANPTVSLSHLWRPVFLGTCEEYPHVEFEGGYSPYYCDEYGKVHPADRIYHGTEATVVADLTVYSEFVYSLIAARASFQRFGGGARRGLDPEGYIGTMMKAEDAAPPLWIVFPYASKLAFIATGLPPGYRFYAAVCLNDDLGPLGTMPRRQRLIWRCQRIKVAGTRHIGLFDHTMDVSPPK